MSVERIATSGFTEDQLLPISALQHLLFCERQCALIHVERSWAENRLTVEGRLLHGRVHEEDDRTRAGVRVVHGLQLVSQQLGLYGVADVVEFRDAGLAFPIEHKRGRPKSYDADVVQLCAEALCLEEMTKRPVSEGALFYGKTRRRLRVVFDDTLRRRTERASSLRFYFLGSNWQRRVEHVGAKPARGLRGPLIV